MSARFWYVSAAGTAEITSYIRTDEWSLTEQAEEGSVGASTLALDDISSALDFDGLHRVYVTDSGQTGDTVVWSGYVADQTISRGDTVLGRQWSLSMNDMNDAWGRRIMTGSDCKRPAETDVARMQWLFTTDESNSFFSDTTSYVSTASPVSMDACDYRGQEFSQVADDCAQASGKNWWASMIYGTTFKTTAWYGADTGTAYTGTVAITNDAALIDGTAYIAPWQDASLLRDSSRVYSGIYLPYDGGAVYRTRSATALAYGKRDNAAPSINVKSKAKATARTTRYLNTFKDQHLRLTCTIRIGASLLNQFRAGMRVQVKFTHLPGLESLTWCRILRRTVSQQAAGTLYDVELEMTPQGVGGSSGAVPAYACPYVFGDTNPGTRDGGVRSYYVGDTPYSKRANIFLLGGVTSNATDYEAFTGSSFDGRITDGFCDYSGYSGARGPSGFYFEISTVAITNQATLSTTSAPASADAIIIWCAAAMGGSRNPTGITLTVDGTAVGTFSPTWSQQWNTTAPLGSDITYLTSGSYYTSSDNGSPWGYRFDLGSLVTGTVWNIAISLATSTNAYTRVMQVQGFNFSH